LKSQTKVGKISYGIVRKNVGGKQHSDFSVARQRYAEVDLFGCFSSPFC